MALFVAVQQRKARARSFRPSGLISFRMVWACLTGILCPCPPTPFLGAPCDCFMALLAIPDAHGNQDDGSMAVGEDRGSRRIKPSSHTGINLMSFVSSAAQPHLWYFAGP